MRGMRGTGPGRPAHTHSRRRPRARTPEALTTTPHLFSLFLSLFTFPQGDELLSDSYDIKDSEDGFFIEVDGKWTEVGDVDVDIGANPSAEEGGDDEGVDGSSRKVVDIIDAFRLVEQPSYNKADFMGYIKPWLAKITDDLPEDKRDDFKAKAQVGIKFLLGKVKELQFFTGESMDPESTMVFAYYKEGATNPTFLFPKAAMHEVKM